MTKVKRMADKYKKRTPASADDWLAGCKETEADPIKAALAENEKRKARLSESIDKKVWENKMSKRSKADWLAGIDGAGTDGFKRGVERKAVKYDRFATAFGPILEAASRQAKGIQVKTIDDALKRVEKVVKFLHEKKGSW